jgi:capsular exopolysaccharide synthesis family protein
MSLAQRGEAAGRAPCTPFVATALKNTPMSQIHAERTAPGMPGQGLVYLTPAADWEDDDPGLTLKDILRIIRRRRGMLLGIIMLGGLLGLLVGIQVTPKYTAKATVVIEPNAGRVIDSEAVLAGLGSDAATVETQIRVIQSRQLAERVMDRERLFHDPEFRPQFPDGPEPDIDFAIEDPWASMVAWMPTSWLIATGLATERLVETDELAGTSGTGHASGAGSALVTSAEAAARAPEPAVGATTSGGPQSPVAPTIVPGATPANDIQAIAAARVQETLSELDPLREAAIDAFGKNLRTSQEGRSRAISVAFTSVDPEKAAAVANGIAEMYVQMQLEAKLQATVKATGWLGDRLEELRRELERAERAVQDYRVANNLAAEGRTDLADQAAVLTNQELLNAQTDLAEKTARLQFLQEMRARGESMASLPEVVGNALIMALRQQESDLLRQEGELRAQFGGKHPRVQQVIADKNKLLGKINAEIDRIVENLANEVKVAEARVGALQASMIGAREVTGATQEAMVRLRELEREANATRSLYESFLMRYKETREQQQIVEPDAKIVSRAAVPRGPSTPGVPVFLAAGLLGSSVLGLFGLVWMERNDEGIRNAQDIERHLKLQQVGFIPLIKDLRRGVAPWQRVIDKPFSAYAESLRSVLAAVRFSNVDEPPRLLLVTSSAPEEGKSTLASSLATAAAQADKRVLLVDLDLRRPSLAQAFRTEPRAGIVELLAGDALANEAVLRHERSRVDLLLVKRRPANPSALIESERMLQLLQAIRRQYDLIVLDTPPVLGVTDAAHLAPLADGVLFVTRWAETKRGLAQSALTTLRAAKANVIGVVLTQVDIDKHREYGYGDVGEYYGKYKKYYTE